MTTRMLIDARHREETRVAVVKGNRIEEFDFESAERRQLKGNIYLAKVIRVEPSLQAAFVDYGGNRHGFLAFSEIHPDYYQIPKEDRDALLREEAEHAAEEAALRAEQDDADDAAGGGEENGEDDWHDYDQDPTGGDPDFDTRDEVTTVGDDEAQLDQDDAAEGSKGSSRKTRGNDDQVEALRQRRMNLRRRYKIQDVIRRRQVLLVQVVKEERGNKGAALTTYLSLAGRYCVLMPNTSHGGGISRKISNAGDRKRLKTIMAELSLPPSMGCIVRTAGLQRTKTEIKRDFDYLARLWDEIREKTLSSSAPALVYADSDLMKRAIRDIYNKDIDEVIVEGDEGYRQAKDFMRLLMPSHAKKVRHYSDPVPLYQRAGVEEQLSAMYHPVVQLKSGGYLVINPTEALVSIDINSGRSTREHNIEQTATATNLEAAKEIARQLRLRDMAGLVVIDFIDMDHSSNVRKVEKAMKDALKDDRARIQVGRISSFGLMEMSRQRLRTGVLEASTRGCPHCEGTGLVRTASSAGLSALRMIEDEAARGRGSLLTLRASQEAAFYVLNRKRADIAEIEDRYGVEVEILPDGEQEGARMGVEASGPPPAYAPKFEPIVEEVEDDIEDEIDDEDVEEVAESEPDAEPRRSEPREEGSGGSRKRRRRRGRRGRPGEREDQPGDETGGELGSETVGDEGAEDAGDAEDEGTQAEAAAEAGEPVAEPSGSSRRRRSRRRRGRRDETGSGAVEADRAEEGDAEATDAVVIGDEGPASEPAAAAEFVGEVPLEPEPAGSAPDEPEAPAPKRSRRKSTKAEEAPAEPVVGDAEAEEAPKPKRSRARKAPVQPEADAAVPASNADVAEVAPAAEESKPKRSRSRKKVEVAETPAEPVATAEPEGAPEDAVVEAAGAVEPEEATPTPAASNDTAPEDAGDGSGPRRGWWQRTFGA